MNVLSVLRPALVRYPVLWITVAVLLAHALVLQAMPLTTDTGTVAPPVLVFSTRTVPAPALAAEPVASSRGLVPVAASPQRKGHLAPPAPLPAVSALPPSDGHSFAATVVGLPDADLGASAVEPVAVSGPPLSTVAPDEAAVAEPRQVVAALSGQEILQADAATHSRQRSHREALSSRQAGAAPVHIPPPQQLKFEVLGEVKRFQYRASAELLWQHDGQHYQARQEVKVLFLGSRTQSSQGDITASGLRPLHFSDQSRREQTADFDYEHGLIRFNSGSPEASLLPGTQDRLSIFIQLGALLAANPERYPTGSHIQMNTAGGRNANPWTFRIEGPETLNLPVGTLSAIKLQRLPQDPNDHEQQAQLWLAPSLGYLPARIQLTQNNGDFVDLRLNSHHEP